MSVPEVKRRVRTITRMTIDHTVTLSLRDVVQMFTDQYHAIPPDANVTIRVPSGADWSGETLSLDDVGGLEISWRESRHAETVE